MSVLLELHDGLLPWRGLTDGSRVAPHIPAGERARVGRLLLDDTDAMVLEVVRAHLWWDLLEPTLLDANLRSLGPSLHASATSQYGFASFTSDRLMQAARGGRPDRKGLLNRCQFVLHLLGDFGALERALGTTRWAQVRELRQRWEAVTGGALVAAARCLEAARGARVVVFGRAPLLLSLALLALLGLAPLVDLRDVWSIAAGPAPLAAHLVGAAAGTRRVALLSEWAPEPVVREAGLVLAAEAVPRVLEAAARIATF